jgi:hypothetical protein
MSSKTSYELEKMSRADLVGLTVALSDGRKGEIVHVEYDSPERVALVKTYKETPSPLTRAAVDRMSPSHLPFISELLSGETGPKAAGKKEVSEEETEA